MTSTPPKKAPPGAKPPPARRNANGQAPVKPSAAALALDELPPAQRIERENDLA
jgi:hypothetical protein